LLILSSIGVQGNISGRSTVVRDIGGMRVREMGRIIPWANSPSQMEMLTYGLIQL
jgi:hypothetical protein